VRLAAAPVTTERRASVDAAMRSRRVLILIPNLLKNELQYTSRAKPPQTFVTVASGRFKLGHREILIRPLRVKTGHRPYSKGRNSPVRSLATSGERSGSSPAQSRHWNLRPPIFLRSKNCIGLQHFGQSGGGGGVLGHETLTLDQARALSNSLSPITA
jgi:hypothetical protein